MVSHWGKRKKEESGMIWRFKLGFKVCQEIRGMQKKLVVERSWVGRGRDDQFVFKNTAFLMEHPGSGAVVNVQQLALGGIKEKREPLIDSAC